MYSMLNITFENKELARLATGSQIITKIENTELAKLATGP
jgi:hypothetical protein